MSPVKQYQPGEGEIDMDPKQAFLAYEDLKRQEKDIKGQIDALKPFLLKVFPGDVDEIPLENGVIMRKEGRKSWKYSEALTAKIETVEEEKEREQQTGAATAKSGESFLEYRAAK